MKTQITLHCILLTLIISGFTLPNLKPNESPETFVSGYVQYENGTPIPGVFVFISGEFEDVTQTDDQGNYFFESIPDGSDFTITPVLNPKQCDPECISVRDQLHIASHILGASPFQSPYQVIAADLNNSNSLTTSDLINHRNFVLNLSSSFDNNTCYRFVNAAYVFPNPNEPWLEPWPESVNIANGSGEVSANFIGIKTGNIDNCPTLQSIQAPLTFSAGSATVCQGDQVCIPITTEDFEDILAFQYSINYDQNLLEFSSVMNFNLPGLTSSNFGVPNALPEGAVTVGWFDNTQAGVSVPDGTELFEICFDVIGSPGQISPMNITGTPTPIEVVNSALEIVDAVFENGTVTITGPMCPTDIEVMPVPGECGAIVNWIVPDSMDNCGNAWTLSSTHQPGDFFPPGTTEVTYSGPGTNGTDFECSFLITVSGAPSVYIVDCLENLQAEAYEQDCTFPLLDYAEFLTLDSCFFEKTWKDIGAGFRFSVGIQEDGTLWSWGDNEFGQLGDGTYIDQNAPQQIGNDNDWQAVSCGLNFTVALKTDGSLWAWGINLFGQLGQGDFTDLNVPQQIGTSNQWIDVKTGQNHCLALQNNGTLWAWGENMGGQLGQGDFLSRTTPQPIGMDNDWVVIAAGGQASMASKTNGTLWGAGTNYANLMQAGNFVTAQNTFQQVGSNSNWETFDVGSHFLGINDSGELWSWGSNFYEQVGNGTNVNQETPYQIGTDTNWEKVFAKSDGSFAIKTDGSLFAWGQNIAGELGLGFSGSNQNTPVLVSTGPWEMAEFGYEHSFGIQTNGSLWACGPNAEGELGLGFTDFNLQTTFLQVNPQLSYTITQSPPPGTPMPPGNHTVTITLTDQNGNESTCISNLEVIDQIEPFVVCQDAITVSLPPNGILLLDPENILEFYVDDCGPVDILVEPAIFDCSNVGQTFPVNVTVTDLTGNASSCWSEVTIVDQMAPAITCPEDMEVFIPCEDFETFVDLLPPVVTDNCAADFQCSHSSGFFEIGTTIVTCTATDLSGNQSTCSYNITVSWDPDEPLILDCPDFINLPLNEECQATVPDLLEYIYATGGCVTPLWIDQNPPIGTTLNPGESILAGLYFYDETELVAFCEIGLIVDPNLPPVFTTLPDPIDDIQCHDPLPEVQQLEVTDDCGIPSVTYEVTITPEFTDNCSEYTVTHTWTALDWYTTEITTVSESFQILPDNLPPVFDQLPSAIPDISCNMPLPEPEVLTATDNCSNAVVTSSIDPFTPDPDNPYTITFRWSAVDECGNMSEVTENFQVLPDNTPPSITCPDNISVFAPIGETGMPVEFPDPLVSDDCEASVVCDFTSGDFFECGITTVTCTASDPSGNINICSFDIEVICELPCEPKLACPENIEVECPGIVDLPPPVLEDSCGMDQIICVRSDGLDFDDPFDYGTTVINCTVITTEGITDSCSYEVTVLTPAAPLTIDCPIDQVFTVPFGIPSLVINNLAPQNISGGIPPYNVFYDLTGATFNNGSGDASGSSFNVGQTTVTYFVTDACGELNSCTFTITVNEETSDLANFVLSDETTQVGNLVCVELSVNHFNNILGFQYTIEYDPTILTFVNTSNYNLPYLNGNNFNDSPSGFINVSWTDLDGSGETLPDGSIICELCFTGDAVGLSDLHFSSATTLQEVTNVNQQVINATYKDGSIEVLEPMNDCDGLTLEAVDLQEETGNCCWQLNYNHNFGQDLAGIRITALDDMEILYDPGDIHPALFDIVNQPGSVTLVASSGTGNPIPEGQLTDFFRFCLTGMSVQPQQIHIEWLDTDFQTVCDTTIVTDCPPEPDDCLYITQDSVYCNGDLIQYDVTFKNPLSCNFPVGKIVIDVTIPSDGAPVTQVIYPVPAIQPGDTYDYTFVINDPTLGGEELCFNIIAHDALDPLNCCASDSTHCVILPKCEPCEFVDTELVLQDSTAIDSCCYTLNIFNDFQTNFFSSIMVEILNPGVSFDDIDYDLTSGFLNTHNADYSKLTWIHTSGFIPVYTGQLFDFCLENISTTAPVYASVHWMQGDSIVCADTLRMDCHDCFILEEGTEVNCDENKDYVFTLNFQNISDSQINTIKIVEQAPNDFITDEYIDLGGIFNPGDHIGPLDIPIDGAAGPGEYCFDISLKFLTEDSLSIDCCFLEHCVWLPDCDSLCCFYPLDYQMALLEGFDHEVSCEEQLVTAYPNGTNFCDRVEWSFRKLGSGATIGGVTYGTSEVIFNAMEIGTYELCMNIIREGPEGEECFPGQGLEICDLVYVSCEELCVDESLIDPNFICPGFEFPVCGCDGITYQNACIARWHYGVTTWTLGECDVFEIQIPVENDTHFYMTNPIENELRFGWKGRQLTEILIYNLHGQMIQRTLTDHDEDGFTQLDVSTLPPGLYILQVSDSEGNVRTEKFVKT